MTTPPLTGSVAEQTLSVQLEQAGIPFEREFVFAAPRKWRADFAVWHSLAPHYAYDPTLLIEIDGGAFIPGGGRHSRGTGVEKDAEKQSAAAILGYRVIRCTPRQVENGTALSWIRQALGVEEAA
jgi:very-short-patch-repair endonuclease